MKREMAFFFFFFPILEKGASESAQQFVNAVIVSLNVESGGRVRWSLYTRLCGTRSFALLMPEHAAKFNPFIDRDVKGSIKKKWVFT